MKAPANTLIIASLMINFVLMLIIFAVYGSGFGIAALVFVLISVAGLLIVMVNGGKAGYIIFMIGCFFFVPIGGIGIYGARKKLGELKKRGDPAADAPPPETAPEKNVPAADPNDGVYLNGERIGD
jgi:hypothetical protein